jgi:inner membrane protein
MVPDVDLITRLWGEGSYLYYHRGLSHSLAGGAALAGLLALGVKLFKGGAKPEARSGPFWHLWVGAYAGVLLHILLDLITGYGTQVLLPFHEARLALDWVFIIDIALTLTFALPLLLGLLLRRFACPIARAGLAASALYLALAAWDHTGALEHFKGALRRQGLSPESVAAMPAPGALFRWAGLLPPDAPRWVGLARADGRTFRAFMVNPSGPPPPLASIEDASPNPYIAKSEELAMVQLFRWFARFPHVSYYRAGPGHVVEYFDLRFDVDPRGRRRPFLLRVLLDEAGAVKKIEFQ